MRRRLALPLHHPGKLRHESGIERALGEQRPEQIGEPLGHREGLGHQRCGALTSAVKAFDTKSTDQGDLSYLENALAPAVRQVAGQPGDRVTNAVRANVALTLGQLRQSPVLGPLEQRGAVKLVGGYYSLDTGKVDVI